MKIEHCIYLGSKMSSHVEAIGTCIMISSNGFMLCLEKVSCVPSSDKNVILNFYFAIWTFGCFF